MVIVGNGRGYLCAILAGPIERAGTQDALDAINADLPHYRQIRNFVIISDPFTSQSGLLTAMGKLRRDAINVHFQKEIAMMYEGPKESAVSAVGK